MDHSDLPVLSVATIDRAISWLLARNAPREQFPTFGCYRCPGCNEPIYVMSFADSPLVVPMHHETFGPGETRPFHWCRGRVPDVDFAQLVKQAKAYKRNPAGWPPHYTLVLDALDAMLTPPTLKECLAKGAVFNDLLKRHPIIGNDGGNEVTL
jgi:hypothetical protein